MSVRSITPLAAIATALALAACGSSGSHHAPPHKRTIATSLRGPCSPVATAALAKAVHLSENAISARFFTPPSGVAACRFTAQHLNVVATLDAAPQAYQRFNRTTVEYQQNVVWAHLGAKANLVTIFHLGLGADWIPPQHEVITTDGVRLITVTVTTAPTSTGQPQAVAARLARIYLGPLHDPYAS